MTARVPVIAIDGPSGSGKGTIAQRVARELGWHRLDSGALYRCVGLAALGEAIPLTDEEALAAMALRLDLRFVPGAEAGAERVWLDGRDVTEAIRTEECGQAASQVAALPAVRQALLTRQRAFAVAPGLVADGRDMGTMVFPEAALKVFLTASIEERARRRYKQLKEKGIGVSLRDLSRGIADRDQRDASRAVAPLMPADDAHVLDSTDLSPDAVVQQVMEWISATGMPAA